MRTSKSLVESIVYSRNEEVAWIVSKDSRVIEAAAEYDAHIAVVEAATDHETVDALMSAVTHMSGMELDAAYRVGLLDGMRLARELRDLGIEYEHILHSFKNPEPAQVTSNVQRQVI